MNGRDHLGTLTVATGAHGGAYSLPVRGSDDASRLQFVAGYEGRRGRVCLASSTDGATFFNIDNQHDRTDRGLNDDCLSAPGVAGSNSVCSVCQSLEPRTQLIGIL